MALLLAGDVESAEDAWRRLRERDPTNPAAAVFEANTLFWRQMYDDEDTTFDEPILERADEAERLARARLEARPRDLEARFYLGQALMMRGRLDAIRGRFVRAGTNGEAAREHLEQVLAVRPGWTDARYQLGLYYFYASLVPKLVTRWLGWLWFVPSGDGATGLTYLEDVVSRGDLFRDEAAFILTDIYTHHEPRIERASEMILGLRARYPRNALIHFERIEVSLAAHDYDAVIRETAALASSDARNVREEGRQLVSHIWRARAEIGLGRAEAAWSTLRPFGDPPPRRPSWAAPWIDLARGQALDLLGDRATALRHYERVLAYREPQGSRRASGLARQGLEEPFRAETSASP
jgi:tetratricopeptide (TPR) repeat protein